MLIKYLINFQGDTDWWLGGEGCELPLHPQKSFIWKSKGFVRRASLQSPTIWHHCCWRNSES